MTIACSIPTLTPVEAEDNATTTGSLVNINANTTLAKVSRIVIGTIAHLRITTPGPGDYELFTPAGISLGARTDNGYGLFYPDAPLAENGRYTLKTAAGAIISHFDVKDYTNSYLGEPHEIIKITELPVCGAAVLCAGPYLLQEMNFDDRGNPRCSRETPVGPYVDDTRHW